MRKQSSGLIAKIVILLLILALGLWGIGDVFRQAVGDQVVATYDGGSITLPELEQTLNRLSSQIPELTPEVARSLPVRMDTLNRLLNTRLIYHDFSEMGLHVSEDVLAKAIATDPNFANTDGTFDADVFKQTLRRNNISEQMFLDQYRQDVQLALVDDTIRNGVAVPQAMVDLYTKVHAQTRQASLVLLDKKAIEGSIPAPTDEQLNELYEQDKDAFYVPEKRELRYVSFDAQRLQELLNIQVSDDELRARYDSQQDLYTASETRNVEQYNFADEAAAKEGHDAITQGEQPNQPVILGKVSYSDLPESVAHAIYDLKEGEITEPVESEFGWQVYKVTHVTPEHTRPFEEVRDDVESAAMADVMENRVNDVAEALDDQIAQGATLEEALKANDLGSLEISTLSTSEGSAPQDGLASEVATAGFDLNEGEISPVLLSADNHYYLVQATSVTPGYTRDMADVKPELERRYTAQQERERLRDKAQEVSETLRKSDNVIQAMQATGYDVVISDSLRRDAEKIGNLQVTGGLMTEIFRLPQGGVSEGYPLPDGEYAVAVVTSITDAPDDARASEAVGATLRLAQQNALFEAYLRGLRERYDVDVDTEALMADTQDAQ
tara:strand:+ start:176 stop:2008 length:1833 start_codon:yes stop_codon:yes gene_type:complete